MERTSSGNVELPSICIEEDLKVSTGPQSTSDATPFSDMVRNPPQRPPRIRSITWSPGCDVDSPSMRISEASQSGNSLSRKESYKDQRKKYRHEKKRVLREHMSSLKDPSVVVLEDWLKVRGSLKGWAKLWCVIKPNMLILYKSSKAKSSHWKGTVLLSLCELIERPSKKDGFCFKLFHPLEQSIWSAKGPEGESYGFQQLPTSHLIFRAPSQAAGKCWMDALELSIRCMALPRSVTANRTDQSGNAPKPATKLNEWEIERHFKDQVDQLEESSSEFSREVTPVDTPDLFNTMLPLPFAHMNNLSVRFRRASSPLKCLREKVPSGRYSLQMNSFDPCLLTPVRKTGVCQIRRSSLDLDDTSHTDENEPHRESGNYSGAELHSMSESESETSGRLEDFVDPEDDYEPVESNYVPQSEEYIDEDGKQTEELGEENKSIIWFILKQVRPGMDLSKVVLPTFILEPRSFLDKLSDYYYHADILSQAVLEDDPYTRMKEVLRWYLSGFYKKPKGLKKPYNPILGETFRCCWKHPSGSRTFYVAEQVSHHPPVSALYVTNRQEGFSISATILAKSKFYGNSTSAILDGTARLALLPRGEDYVMNMPYAYCKGILMGTLTMELGGKVSIECEKTGYMAELEFKLKPFLSSGDASNLVIGKLKLGKDTLANVEGRWDKKIILKDKRTGEEEILWEVTKEVKERRLPRYTIHANDQYDNESERLWRYVSDAIRKDDQDAATEEKTLLEEAQRTAARELKVKCELFSPKYFRLDPAIGAYSYIYADLRPWDTRTDLFQYESSYEVSTKTRHKAPMIRTSSIISVELQKCETIRNTESKHRLRGVKELRADETTDLDVDNVDVLNDEIPETEDPPASPPYDSQDILAEVNGNQTRLLSELKAIRKDLDSVKRCIYDTQKSIVDPSLLNTSWTSVVIALIIYSLFQWFCRKLFGWT